MTGGADPPPGGARPHPSRRSRARKPRRPVPAPVPPRPGRARAALAARRRGRRARGARRPRVRGRRRTARDLPAPGTPDASPQTQISVLGVAPARIASVRRRRRARAARTPGACAPTRGSRGASFVPATPFAAGERVRVAVRVRGRAPVRFAFTVAAAGVTPPVLQHHRHAAGQARSTSSPSPASCRRASPCTATAAGRAARSSSRRCRRRSSTRAARHTVTISPVGPGGPMIVDGRGRARVVPAAHAARRRGEPAGPALSRARAC